MAKINICSSCTFKKITKNYLLFLSVAVIILFYGFLFSTAFASTNIDEYITENTHWVLSGSPYLITNDIYVPSGVKLTIDKGVVVKFDYGYGLYLDGELEALGTTTDKIYFTSFYDDEFGGDTDGSYEDCYYSDYDEEGYGIGKEICDTYDDSPYEDDWAGITGLSSTSKLKLNNVVNIYSSDGLLVYNGATVSSVNYNSDQSVDIYKSIGNSFYGLEIPSIEIYGNSAVEITKAEMSEIDLYLYSTLIINDSNINGTDLHDGIDVFSGSSLVATNLNIECKNDCISVFSESKAILTKLKIKGAQDAGVIAFNNINSDGVVINKSEITGNENAFLVWDSPFSSNENSIYNNVNGAVTYDTDLDSIFKYNFTSNYWGDRTGPTHTSNPLGKGDIVSDNIIFEPFLKYDPLVNIRNPVILIPGITGSYLNKLYGDKGEIWPDILKLMSPLDLFDLFLNELSLNEDGTEKIEFPIIPGDIIRGISTVHVFDKLIEGFINDGYVEGTDLFVFPYDWRLSTKSTADLLKVKIDEILLKTEQEKVDIIAHSMGGLIAKKYIADNGKDKVDQLFFLGTPQLGAPKAFKVLMYGDNMGYGFNIYKEKNVKINILNPLRVKYISQNMPSVYELLPSFKYIKENGSYVTNALKEIILPGSSIKLDYSETKDLMIKEGRNSLMFPFAKDLHDSIDDLDLSDMKSYNFVGCGSPTIGRITIDQKRSWKKLFLGLSDDYQIKYIDGDETVPFDSATKTIGSDIYYAVGVSHGSPPSSESVTQGILAILKNEGLNFGDVLKDDSSSCGVEGKVISTHSPVELHVYDENGNHTGLNDDGDIEYGIEGVSFDILEGENYVFLPNNKNFKVVTKATDTGGYNFLIEDQDKNNNIIDTHKWTLIPLETLNTIGEIWVGPDYLPNDYEVKIDNNGDGIIDENYKSSYDGISIAEEFIIKNIKNEEKNNSNTSGSMIPKIQNINFKQIITPKDEVVKVIQYKNKLEGKKIIVENELKVKEDYTNKVTKEDINIRNNLLASIGFINIKDNIISIVIVSILVLLLAIKFIIKVK